MRIELSVVIVTYNSSLYILNCLRSLSKVCTFPTQVLVIDNASNDQTVDILQHHKPEFIKTFSFFEIIENNKNTGYTHGVNQGLHRTKGHKVLLLNPDIRVTGDIKVLMNLLDDSRIGVVAPQLKNENGTVQPSCRRFPRRRDVFLECLGTLFFRKNIIFNRWKMPDFNHLTHYDNCQPQGAFLLTRRNVLREIGLLDERFHMFFSDVDWCQRVIEHGYIVRFTPCTSMIHLKGKSVFQRRQEMIISSHRAFVQYFKKQDHAWIQQIGTRLVYLLLLIGTLPRLIITAMRQN